MAPTVMRTSLIAALLFAGCTNLSTQGNVLSTQDGGSDGGGGGSGDGGEADAGTCTPLNEADQWQVKVLLVVEQSGRMCVFDPPGSQGAPGFCEQAESIIFPDGGIETQPARVRALKQLTTDIAVNKPTATLALEAFVVNSAEIFPFTTSFERPDSMLFNIIDQLQSTLGQGADTQGALTLAHDIIATDIAHAGSYQPNLLSKTRYVVLLVSSGVPTPRCSANDALSTYADPAHPDGIWGDDPSNTEPDCLGYGCGAPLGDDAGTGQSLCNDYCVGPSNCGPEGFIPGTDRNQNKQLTDAVDAIVALRDMPDAGVGDVQVHTALIYDVQSFDACGGFCSSMFAPYNGDAMRGAAAWLLQQLALHGRGTFHDLGSPLSADFSWLDTTPLTTFCPTP